MAVGQIIDDATCRAGQEGARNKDCEKSRIRHPARRQPECPQSGPQEKQGANRFVEADQFKKRIGL